MIKSSLVSLVAAGQHSLPGEKRDDCGDGRQDAQTAPRLPLQRRARLHEAKTRQVEKLGVVCRMRWNNVLEHGRLPYEHTILTRLTLSDKSCTSTSNGSFL